MNSLSKLLITILFVLPFATFAQPDSLWMKQYGNRKNPVIREVILLSTGEYLIAGDENRTINFYTSLEIAITKADSAGNQLWYRTYGEPPRLHYRRDEFVHSVAERHNGGYLISGGASNEDESTRLGMIMAISEDGDSLWLRKYESISAYLAKVIPQLDGGFIAIGRRSSHFWLFKADSVGEVEWERDYEQVRVSRNGGTMQCSDDGFLMTGRVGTRMTALKTNSAGDIEWARIYERPDTLRAVYNGESSGVVEADDGGFIISGWAQGQMSLGYVLRLDSEGNKIWDTAIGNERGTNATLCFSVIQVSNGGIVVAGYAFAPLGPGTGDLFYLARLDQHGEKIWESYYGETNGRSYSCRSVIATPDGGYALAGNEFGRIHLLKTGPDPTDIHVTIPVDTLHFPDVRPSYTTTLEVSIHNNSPFPIVLDRIYCESQVFYCVDFDSLPDIPVGEDLVISVAFSPTDYTYYSAELYIRAAYDHHRGAFRDFNLSLTGTGSMFASVDDNPIGPHSLPKAFALHPLFPNPFNSSTQIRFDLPSASEVSLSIFDINGRLLTNLVNGSVSAGSHAITWNASGYATGIYFVKMETGNGVKFIQKAVVIK